MENIMKTLICDSIELTNISRTRLFDLISSVSDNMPIEKIAEIAYYLQDKVEQMNFQKQSNTKTIRMLNSLAITSSKTL